MRTQQINNSFEPSVADFHIPQVVHRLTQVVLAGAKLAGALAYQFEGFLVCQLARVLGMAAVDEEGQGVNRPFMTCHRNAFENLDINVGGLFSLAEIEQRFMPLRGGHLKHQATTRATPIQAKDEPWLVWCTSVLMRVDAETAMEAMQRGWQRTDELKSRTPHQGAVAKDPEVVLPRCHPSLV
jgi:hypothetical protein